MKPVFIAGPCVIESAGLLDEVAADKGGRYYEDRRSACD